MRKMRILAVFARAGLSFVPAYAETSRVIAQPVQSFATLQAYSERTRQDSHSRIVAWSIFRKANPPAPGEPTRLYRPEDYDFSLIANSAAIDAGRFFLESRMATRGVRRTLERWSSAGRCLCTVRARSRISHNDFPLGGYSTFETVQRIPKPF